MYPIQQQYATETERQEINKYKKYENDIKNENENQNEKGKGIKLLLSHVTCICICICILDNNYKQNIYIYI